MVFKHKTIRLSVLNPQLCWVWLAAIVLISGCAGKPVEPSQSISADSQQAPRSQQAPDPKQAFVLAQEGAAAYRQGDILAAINAWQLAVELNPGDAVTHNNLALLLKQKGRFKESAEILQTGLEGSPDIAELHYNLAVISELYLLDLPKALRHYQRYQSLSANEDGKVTGWIADLQRRLD